MTQYPTPTYNSGPGLITAGPDGNYWFYEKTANQLASINPSTGHITEIPLLTSANPGIDGLAAGPNGTLWFTEFNTNQVGEINTANDQISLVPAITPGSQPYGIVEGPDGNMWFTEAGANKIGMINPTTHVVHEYAIDSLGTDEAEGITVGPDKNLWFTLTGTDQIGVMNPTTGNMVAEYAVKTANAAPNSITLGSDGNLWFTESATYKVGTITPKGIVTEFYTNNDAVDPMSIVSGSDKNLWFVGSDYAGVQWINPTTHTINVHAYNYTNTSPATGIAADGNGNFWLTQQNGNQISVFSDASGLSYSEFLPTTNGGPLGITLGPDGNMWFTESEYNYSAGDQIATVQPSNGKITEYALNTASANPDQIVYDPADGNIWFTEQSVNKVGRINPTTKAVGEYAVPSGSNPSTITVDPQGNIWFSEPGTKRIGEFSPNDPNSINQYDIPGTPSGIAAEADGSIWFSEAVTVNFNTTYKIGVFSPSTDTVTAQYAIPSGSGGALIAGPDGNVWFTNGSNIASVTESGTFSQYPIPNATTVALTSGPDGNVWFTASGVYNYNTDIQYPNVIGVVTLTAAASPTQLAVSTQPPGSVTAAKGFGLVVSVDNAAGNPDLNYSGSVTITLASNPAGDTLNGTLTEPVIDGKAIFSGLTLKDAGTGYTIQATATGLTPVTTSAFNVSLGATKLDVSAEPPANVGAGTAFGLTVAAEDGQGNIDTTYNGPITLKLGNNPANGTLSGVLVLGAIDGVATFTGLSLNVPAKDYTILASSGSLTSATSIGFNVTAGQATQLVVAPSGEPPASILAGGLFGVTLIAEDQYGDPATDFTGSVSLSLANGGSVVLQGNTTANASGGQVTFSGLAIDTVGDYQIQATSTNVSSATTSFINVNPGAATQLVVESGNPPSSIAAGSTFGFNVDAEDQYFNLDATFDGAVVADNSSVAIHGLTSVTAKAGVATFSGLSIDKAGTFTIQLTSGSLQAGAAGPITITAGAAKTLAIATEPPSSIGSAQLFGLTVSADDQYSNPISSFAGTVTIALVTPAGATLSGTLTKTALGGQAVFSRLSIDKTGTYTIQATSPSLTSAISSGIVVSAAAASQLVIQTPPSGVATAGQSFPVQPVLYLEDANGNLETNDNTTQVTASLGGGAGPLLGTTTVTVHGGIATFAGLYDKRAETITLDFATASGLSAGPTGGTIVNPDTATQLVITTEPPANASAGVAFVPQPVIVEEDQFGNVETGDNKTVITAQLATGAGPISNTTATVAAGVATFSGLLDPTEETITLKFTGGGLTSQPSSSIDVGAGTATQLVFVTPPYTLVTAGTPLTDPIVVAEEDKYGNVVTSDSSSVVTASLATGGGTLYGATTATVKNGIASFDKLEDDTAGTLTLSFSTSQLPPLVAKPSTVTPAAATRLSIKRPPGGVIAGGTFPILVDALDPYGNVDTSFNGVVTLKSPNATLSGTQSVTASSGEADFTDLSTTASGDISLSASSGTISTGTSGGSTVTVSPAAAFGFVVVSQPITSAIAGQSLATSTQEIILNEVDQYGNLESGDNATSVIASLSNQGASLTGTKSVTVSGGVATFTDLATTTAGTQTIVFNDGSLNPGMSSPITVSPAVATQLVVQAQPPKNAVAGVAFSPARHRRGGQVRERRDGGQYDQHLGLARDRDRAVNWDHGRHAERWCRHLRKPL